MLKTPLDAQGRGRRLLEQAAFVCSHGDADGLAAAALAARWRQEAAVSIILLARGQTPFEPGLLPGERPAALLDWGVRPFDGSVVFVDHHFPEAHPSEEQVVVSGYGEQPEVSTSVLVARLIGQQAASWVAAVGAVGDLGDRAWQLPDLNGVAKSHIRSLVPLINAPRRVPSGPVRTALAILVESESPCAALADPRASELLAAKEAWRAALKQALKVAPQVEGGLALIRFSSQYQIHPLVAQTWARRLGATVVMAANDDYLPGKVNFAVRGGSGDLRACLRGALPDEEGEFAHGHDRATGGSLTPERFDTLVRRLRT